MSFLIKCKKCGNSMKYNPHNMKDFSKKIKRCVYCGYSIKVKDYIVKEIE